MKYSSNKDINKYIQKLIKKGGWNYKRGKKHGRISPPLGFPTLTIPTSPSDSHAFMNFKRESIRADLGINPFFTVVA